MRAGRCEEGREVGRDRYGDYERKRERERESSESKVEETGV